MINLLPYNEKAIIERVRIVRMITVTLFSLIVLALTLCLLLTPTMLTINSRHTLWQGEIQRLENAGAAVSAESLAQSEMRSELLKKQFAASSSYSPVDAILLARSTAPNGVLLSGFAYTAGTEHTLSIQGVVTTREVLQSYVETLQSHERVSMVDNPVSNYLKQRDNEFILTITFK